MKVLENGEITLEVDDEESNGAISSIRRGGKEYVNYSRKSYGVRWGGFFDGQELSQTDYRLSASRIGFETTESAHPPFKPPGAPPAPDDPEPESASQVSESSTSVFEGSFTPTHPEKIEQPYEIIRNKVSLNFLNLPNVIRFQTRMQLARASSGVNSSSEWAPELLGIEGASNLPHCLIAAPYVYPEEELARQAYTFDVGFRRRRVRILETDNAPIDGGPICGSGDGTHALGIYQFAPNYPAYGFVSQRVQWRRGTDRDDTRWREMAIVDVSRPGLSISKGTQSRDLFLVLGTTEEVEDTFITLHNFFVLQRKNNDRIRLGSAIGLEPISL